MRLTGYRPALGRYPAQGLVSISSTRDTLGIIAGSVTDVAIVDGVLGRAGFRPQHTSGDLNGVTFGRPAAMVETDFDPAVWHAYESAFTTVIGAGARIVDVDVMYLVDGSLDSGTTIALYEFPTALKAYLARSHPGLSVADVGRGVASPDVRKMWNLAMTGAIAAGDYRNAMARRQDARRGYRDLFSVSAVTALIFPTTPVTARQIGEDDTIPLRSTRVPAFETYIHQPREHHRVTRDHSPRRTRRARAPHRSGTRRPPRSRRGAAAHRAPCGAGSSRDLGRV